VRSVINRSFVKMENWNNLRGDEVLPIQQQLSILQQPDSSSEFPWDSLQHYLGNNILFIEASMQFSF
jgi:hypothetical protein